MSAEPVLLLLGLSTSAQTQGVQTAQEVKKEVLQILKEKQRLETSLPSLIVIGPFTVSVDRVRQALSEKKKALANGMMDYLASKIRKQVDQVSPR